MVWPFWSSTRRRPFPPVDVRARWRGRYVPLLEALEDRTAPAYKLVPDWPRLPEEIKFGQVTAVATDSADRVHVFHRGPRPIVVLDAGGQYLRSWGDDLVKNAHGLRVDRDDNVWITDLAHHQVMQFDPRGKLLLTLGKKDSPGESKEQFNKPADVAFGAAGEVYVADGYGNSRVVKFSKDGKYVTEWGKKGTGEGEFNLPHAVRTDDKGRVYVGDRENNRVQVFDADGKFLTQWKATGAPFGLFLTRDRQMLLADGRADVAKVLDLEGKSLGRWGEKGTAAGQFNLPHSICMDSKGAVYVGEIDGRRVQKFIEGEVQKLRRSSRPPRHASPVEVEGKTEKVGASPLFSLDFQPLSVYNSRLLCIYEEEIPSAHLFPITVKSRGSTTSHSARLPSAPDCFGMRGGVAPREGDPLDPACAVGVVHPRFTAPPRRAGVRDGVPPSPW